MKTILRVLNMFYSFVCKYKNSANATTYTCTHTFCRPSILFVIKVTISRHYCDGNHHRGPAIAIVSSSLKHEMYNKDTNCHVASVDHVKMNSWCKFGECSAHMHCNTV